VPNLVVRHLAPATPQPLIEHFTAAVLFVDITGFTALAEQLTRRDLAGAEALSQVLNEYFGQLTTLIADHGGDIMKFAGDALLAVWLAADRPESAAQPAAALRQATLRAAQCALAIQALLHSYQVGAIALAMRIGIGAGPVSAVHIGGRYGRWEFALLGSALAHVSQAEQLAQPGDVVLAPAAWDLIADSIASEALASGGYQRLLSLGAPVPIVPLALATLPAQAESALRAYIPEVVLDRISASQTSYLSELRRVTVLFIQLPELAPERLEVELNRLQALIEALQMTLERFEGSLNKVSIDDKGLALVAAFGLPPHAHEDDAGRGVLAALEMQQQLIAHGFPCSIGITTGRAFCGTVGGATRREYTLIGASVNLAARLMQASKASTPSPAILCDEATYLAAQERASFERLPDIMVKGRSTATGIYRPILATATARKPKTLALRPIVGRAEERAGLVAALESLQQRRGGVCIIEGEAGLGKSRLVEELQDLAYALNLSVGIGASDAVEQTTPYHSWRDVFQELLALDPGSDPALRREQVERAIGPGLRDYAPLLSAMLQLDMPDNDLTRPMTDQLRAENTRAVLIAILGNVAASRPLLLILEDTHWMDSASWALALEVGRRISSALLILATRPLAEPIPAAFSELAALAETRYLRLQPLAAESILALVCQSLAVRQLPPEVEALIQHKAEGNPFFSEELAYALRDTGILQITAGECHVAPNIDLSQITFPDTVQGVVASRIDKLSPPQQLALKVASVIGRVFAFRVLGAVYPVAVDKPQLPTYLEVLQRLDITPRDLSTLELQYTFKHAITQEVAYSFLLFAQRRELHRAIAEWYEASATDLTPFHPLLAHHWSRAIEETQAADPARAKAIRYLTLAGEQALRTSAFREARTFFEQALALTPAAAETLERAQLLNNLGETYFQLSDYNAAQDQLKASLALARAVEDRQGIVNALSNLGRVGWQLGTYAEAQLYLEEGLELATDLHDLTGVAHILTNLGVVAYYRSKNAQARFYFERSLQLSRELGEPVLIGSLLNNVGNAARMDGEYDKARAYYAEGLEVCQKYNIHWVMAMLLGNLALVAHTTGALAEAQGYHEASLRLHRQNGNKWGISIVKREMGLLADELGHDQQAIEDYYAGLTIALEINALPKALSNLAGFAKLCGRIGLEERAVALIGFVLAHPATDSEARRIIQPLEESLQALFAPERYAALLERGRALDIQATVAIIAALLTP
jgi:class 3 adenylate cyclase/tetratricopeptide (TPR) repeat protein